ncbi:dna-binding protein smubp-2 [Plasmopara halstedii]|uniref:DNA helicase n=1 Tax=Plasmopara halstedii TaxID=4781 RepID=A0A0P1AL02_PLAHL|nr:dna-binding protein smubp-2 [Plasmopara halstedii]CEG41368.1 dna-binding protein smubp-2 [Plasmopara halstedii]|eukprot:XP_024577737.1 dna-binding protein smubp-2 [Plasmopara halstedii]
MPKTTETSADALALLPVTLETWLTSTRRLLSIEQQEEVDAMRKELTTLDDRDNPNVLTHLTLARYSTGLFGRMILHLSLPSLHLRQAKPHHFTVGDLVQLRVQKSTSIPTGIVSRVEEHAISVAFNSEHDEIDELALSATTLTLDRLVNTATFAKLTDTLDQMTKLDFGTANKVIDVVFSNRDPSWNTLIPEFQPLHTQLNTSQHEAIRFALASKDLVLIHGPPGTGKTTTVIELILQLIDKYESKVLVCAPSNIAVDNVLEKLASACSKLRKKLNLVRVGHPARVLPQTLKYCLDAKIANAEGTEIVQDIRKELTLMQNKLQKTREKTVKYELRREMKANRKEIRVREQNVVSEIIKQSNVVFATNVGAASKLLKDVTFDVVIIDEAAQALEASCWVPILKAKRCVLAGDHLQLPPTIKSKVAAAKGLEVTLFDRVTRNERLKCVVKMLDTQYRMHEDICNWSSQAMYKGELKSFSAVAKRKLHELPHVTIKKDDDVLNATLLLVDTAGCELDEDEENAEDVKGVHLSKSNEGEARIVAKHVQMLLSAGLKEDEVAVITPYNKQVQTLKGLLLNSFPKLEIRSVDGFQGCEKEAVVMSLVRSNASRQVGFLADDRRMNVAITRAKRHVALICDTDTISSHRFLATIVHHFEQFGEVRSAYEFLEDDTVQGSVDDVMAMTGNFSKTLVVGVSEAKTKRKTKTSKSMKEQKIADDPSSTIVDDRSESHIEEETSKADTEEVMTVEAHSEEAMTADVHTEEASTVKMEIEGARTVEVEPEEISPFEKAMTVEVKFEDERKSSVFQLMDSSSDSSDECDQDNNETKMRPSDFEPSNILLKDLHMSRLARHPAPLKSTKKSKKKKRQGKTNTSPIDKMKDDEDELDYLTRQATKSSKCAYQSQSRCQTSVSMLGSICKFCKLKFCYNHAMPEVHGCGDAVRTFERMTFKHQMKETPSKKLTNDKRKILKKKLQETVAAKSADRSTKPKKK